MTTMASSAHEAFQHPPSIAPPPPPRDFPSGSRSPDRSPGPGSPPASPPPPPPNVRPSSFIVSRKPLPIPNVDPREGAYVPTGVSSQVHVHPPSRSPQPESSAVVIEEAGAQLSPGFSIAPSSRQSFEDASEHIQLSPQNLPIRNGIDATTAAHSHRRVQSLPQAPDSQDLPTNITVTSAAPIMAPPDRSASATLPRLMDKRASKLTMRSTHSDGSSSTDPALRNDYLSPSNPRASFSVLPRPESAYSSVSDLAQTRGRSPQISPSGHARASPSHSLGPLSDQRPISYVDLLNVPYPQPPPVSADHLNNTKLRTSVGQNASLLSTRKTLGMYRANVKKTNDPAIQYEFAVFMITAAQEIPPDPEDASKSDISVASHGDLLKEARQILQKLSDRSYPFAQYYLADGYFSGLLNKGKEDHEKAFTLFVSAAKHGHAEAGYRAALCYEFGWGCRVDGAKATQFYRQAASKNHPGAMLRLGRACLMGDMGLGNKYREGVKWLKRAAESADFQYNAAPFELGQLHEAGYGSDIFQDQTYAAQLYTKSADLGHPDANFKLGEAYEHGRLGCPKDPALSVHFYTGAAQQSHPSAMMALCAWYMLGAEPILERDENEAYEWAKRAAECELPKAEYTIGYFTETGIGCRRDPLEANVWYVRAADHGDERAKHRLAAIRAAATGADPVTAALPKPPPIEKQKRSNTPGSVGPDGEKIPRSKKFGIF